MAINPLIPLQAGQIQSPLTALGQGIQRGQQMAATSQAMDLRRQQQEQLTLEQRRQALGAGIQALQEIKVNDEAGNLDEQATIAARRNMLPNLAGSLQNNFGFQFSPEELAGFDVSNQGLASFGAGIGLQSQEDELSEFQRQNLALQERRLEQTESTELESRDLRERELGLRKQVEQRQQTKLSAPAEKALIEAQDSVVSAQRASNEYNLLSQDYQRLVDSAGLEATVSENFKKMLGTQDDVTEFRRRFNKVRLSEGLKNLPPGPATDRDVKEAFKGVPAENASSEQVASFLRGAARLARFEAAYNQFKADHISNTGSVRHLNREWRKSVRSEKLGKDVSIAEIYEAAQNKGLTPEEVRQRLGI
jgi:hypothetical protein